MKPPKFLVIAFLFACFAFTASAKNSADIKSQDYQIVSVHDQNPVLFAQVNSVDTVMDAATNQTTVSAISTDEEIPLPEPGASVWSWLKFVFLSLGGFVTFRILFFRLLPTSANIDFWEKVIDAFGILIKFILGNFVPNRRKGGGTF